ncbi:MAG TPA: TerB family tellurite resistance protein [Candidatus Deferrimicrobiaceae bacterium]|nr:TerB family tellurite resistance protein [Candidatus Deferrimicrobiaceae bacterium]
MLRRFLGGSGLPDAATAEAPATPGHSQAADTQTVRRIIAELEALPRERARFLAAFAYILTRAAAADLHISEVESREIERLVEEHGKLPEAQAVLVANMAHHQSLLYGATEDYLVTRQFRELSTAEERLALLRCCYIVGAADGTISAEESHTLQQIAHELDVEREDVNELRTEFAPKLAAIQALYQLRRDTAG